ncbi:MAG: EamA family transporter [Bacteroidales bacterium]|nr:EamA family transporter [Bacteroidales bacterium]
MYYIVVITSVFIAALSQLLLKSSSRDRHANVIREYLNWKVMCGYGMMGVSLLMNIFAMSKGIQVKEVSIMESLSYLFVPFLSFLVFKEKLSWRKIGAIAMIMIGVIVFFQ